ncbi:MAG: single-stranded-DNA-specific exonuclease RecJ [Desulfuromonadaceae bacterium]|nr:single-stranded-DNA-specific exonuclease RecJ [Desulfuromonadaceae bacterium]MDD5107682.1 single-stranded-DNA-specific exonuclease RecJ [Desulfuromonadaceae bacterium]
MKKEWRLKSADDKKSLELAATLGIPAAVARVLSGRGIVTGDIAERFLFPSLSSLYDPFILKGMQAAVDRVLRAHITVEKICIYGDYDVDGISGTALLVSFLRQVGCNCSYFIPNRFDDGYGLSKGAIERIIDEGATLIISVDCGITSVNEAAFCRQAGVDLIIIDHHVPGDIVPEAAAVVNPLQPDCSYPFKSLAGVGVAFNLLIALRSSMRSARLFSTGDEPDLRNWLDLVALGTIADVVPLVDQNRIYVSYGLKRLENSFRPGITSLKKVAGIKDTVSCGQVGFRLAPRLNAAGRIESAVPGVELLLGTSMDECSLIAEELDSANAERQAIERAIFEQAVAMIEGDGAYPSRRSIVLASPDWHQGVVGIVASRLVERYHRPTILIAIDDQGYAKGSGRSIPGFHLLEALEPCRPYLERFGGHRYAAGVGLNAVNIDRFSESFEAEACRIITDADLVPLLDIDAVVSPAELDLDFTTELSRLEPFGAGNPEPVLMMRGVTVVERRVVGDGHLKLRVTAGGIAFSAIAFRQADCVTDGVLDIAFYPECNIWNNTTTLQLRIKGIRKAEN